MCPGNRLLTRVPLLSLVVSISLLTALRASAQEIGAAPERKAVPAAEAQAKSLALVKEIFRTEYASRRAEEQRAFAKKLLEQALQTKDDPTSQYVLLKEAIAMAAKGGDVKVAFSACGELAERFEVALIGEQIAAAGPLATLALEPDDRKLLFDACLDMVDGAVATDDFDAAGEAMNIADRIAVRLRDVPMTTRAKQKRAEMAIAKREFGETAAALAKLKDSPDDSQANLAVAKYHCFVKGDWATGLKYLKKGDNIMLKSLAERELQNPTDAKTQSDLAAAWWDAVKVVDAQHRAAVQSHAADWYEKALPELTGLQKLAAEQRIKQAQAAAEATAKPIVKRGRVVDLIKLFDPKRDVIHGKWKAEKGALIHESMHLWPRVQFGYHPPEEFDLKVTFSQEKLRHGITVFLPGGHRWYVGNVYDKGFGFGLDMKTEATGHTAKGIASDKMKPGEKYTVTIKIRKNSWTATLNDKKVNELNPRQIERIQPWGYDVKDKDAIGVGADDPAVFHEILVTEVSGTGKLVGGTKN